MNTKYKLLSLLELLAKIAQAILDKERTRRKMPAFSRGPSIIDSPEEKRKADEEAKQQIKMHPAKDRKAGEVFARRGYEYQWIEKNGEYLLYRLKAGPFTDSQVRAEEDRVRERRVRQKQQPQGVEQRNSQGKKLSASGRSRRRRFRIKAQRSLLVRPAPRQPGELNPNGRSLETYRAAGAAVKSQIPARTAKPTLKR